MTRVADGRDFQSEAMLGFQAPWGGTTATAPTATTVTLDGVNVPVNSLRGRYLIMGTKFGVIQSNTSAASSVVTIDRWYDFTAALPANAGVAAAGTPAAGVWSIPPGQVPAAYIGLTATATPAVDGDTVLTGEITTVGGGLIRHLASYAHTAAAATTTLIKTFTMNGTDAAAVVAQMGVFQGVSVAASRIVFRTVLNATMAFTLSGDQGQVTHTTNL